MKTNGVMEYWSAGVLEIASDAGLFLHHSITAAHRHSVLPHSPTSPLHHSFLC